MLTQLLLFLSLFAIGHAAFCVPAYKEAINCPAKYGGSRDTCLFHRSRYFCCYKLGSNWRCRRQIPHPHCDVKIPPQGSVFEVLGTGSEFSTGRLYHFKCNSQFDLEGPTRVKCLKNVWEEDPPHCKYTGPKERTFVHGDNGCSVTVSKIRNCAANTRCDGHAYEYCEVNNGVPRCCLEDKRTLSSASNGIERTSCISECLNAPPPEPMPPMPTEEPEEPTTEEPEEPTTEEPEEPTTEEPEEPTTEEPEEPTTEEPEEPTTEEPEEPTEKPEEPTTEEPEEPTEKPEEPTTEEPEEPTEKPEEPTTEEPEEPTSEEPEEPKTEKPPTPVPTQKPPPPSPGIVCGITPDRFSHGEIEVTISGVLTYVAFSCEPNYRLIGNSIEVCLFNQLASGGNIPTCVPTLGSRTFLNNDCPVTLFKEEECNGSPCNAGEYCRKKRDNSRDCCEQKVGSLGQSSFGIPGDKCSEECRNFPCQYSDAMPSYCAMPSDPRFCDTLAWMKVLCKATCNC